MRNSTTLGFVPSAYSSTELPFLLKVLSVGTALSIQAHPDKVLAKELNTKFPNIYKGLRYFIFIIGMCYCIDSFLDANHKPEMAIAITKFEALCGFRSEVEILMNIQLYPEFISIISEESKLIVLISL